ncbi:Ser/Thr protein kinase RdoA (MazF antagonist) [Catenulispora sp. GP43]|uniref:phosphotransferase family protein n=1 Tax=Catenulispora sp. GP43 TaxID=3156263 RepID=UPI003512FA9D
MRELTGGRMTGGVVLVDGGAGAGSDASVGDVVRRPAGAASGFVAELLGLFEQRGFGGAPRYLGCEDGADLFSYIPGDVPARFQVWTDEQIAAAGRLLRAMHEATRGSALAGRSPVVCHHDAGPNNAVFQDGVPVAWIDFDTAAPGDPLEDVGYAAWTWCIASKQTAPIARQADQVRILADAYGLTAPERAVLIDAAIERQARNVRFWASVLASGTALADPAAIADRIAWSRREAAFTVTHRAVFDRALAKV